MDEQRLTGGITNTGAVERVGEYVLRPASEHVDSIHSLLRVVREAGFTGVPKPVGVDADGRERLEFVDGEVPLSPYPAWAQSDAALASIARLLRRLHDAAATFDPGVHTWNMALADPAGGSLVCHNDLELSNIVFRGGEAVGFIDFDFAAPGRPIYDVAQFARLCVPIEHDIDQARMGWKPSNHSARLRRIADEYGLDAAGRAELVPAIGDALDQIEAFARSSYDPKDAEAVAALNRIGGIEKYDRRRAWWDEHRALFEQALR